jgi:lipase chaperone LimK
VTRLACGVALASLGLWLLVAVRLPGAPGSEGSTSLAATVGSRELALVEPRRSPAAALVEARVAAEPVVSAPPLPRSLAGTRVDGDFSVDEAGRFVADRGALRLFEYFLSAEGEEPADRIRTRVAGEASQRLPADEAARALALFDRYLLYRAALADSLAGVARGDLRGALATVHELRVDRFGPDEAERLFGADERLAARIIDR